MADTTKIEATNEFCFLYSTYPNTDAAMAAARLAIDRKLAACVNVYPPMKSVYMWEGRCEEQGEVAAFFKTRRSLVEKAMSELWSVHNYSVPCFIVLPIEGGNADYLAWAREQTVQTVTV
jgi:periplasmic divalent cation tolerance protein